MSECVVNEASREAISAGIRRLTDRHEPMILRSRNGSWWRCSCGTGSPLPYYYETVAMAGYGWAEHLAQESKGDADG